MTNNLSQVSTLQAVSHYCNDAQNLALVLATGCFLGRLTVTHLLGKNAADYPALYKIDAAMMNSFTVFEISASLRSIYKTGTILYQGCTAKDENELREVTQGNFPRVDHPYIGRKVWTTYMCAAVLFKMGSSVISAYEGLKRIGALNTSLSPTLRAFGAGLGVLGYSIDMFDTGRAILDGYKDKQDNSCPASKRVKNAQGKDNELHQEHLQAARYYTMASLALLVGENVISIIEILDVVEGGSLLSRVSSFTGQHAEMIEGTVVTAMTVVALAGHIFHGATIEQLEHRNINQG